MTEYELFVRELRKQIAVRGLTQMQVSIDTGSCSSFLNSVLSHGSNMSANKLFRLARYLDIDLGEIQRRATP